MPWPRSLRANAILAPAELYFFSATATLPPLVVQSCELVSVTPWPLQPFWPLQALLALLQAPWPLHSLTPAHITLSPAFFSVLSFANAAPETKSEATAVARTAFFIDMGFPPGSGTSARRYVRAAKPLHAGSSGLKKNSHGDTVRACLAKRPMHCGGSTPAPPFCCFPTPGTSPARASSSRPDFRRLRRPAPASPTCSAIRLASGSAGPRCWTWSAASPRRSPCQ